MNYPYNLLYVFISNFLLSAVCLSVYLSICLSVYLSICLSVRLYVCLSVCLSVACFDQQQQQRGRGLGLGLGLGQGRGRGRGRKLNVRSGQDVGLITNYSDIHIQYNPSVLDGNQLQSWFYCRLNSKCRVAGGCNTFVYVLGGNCQHDIACGIIKLNVAFALSFISNIYLYIYVSIT